MAEGWLRHFGDNKLEVFSAGTHPEKVNPLAIRVMLESGINISTHTSNHIDEYLGEDFDFVISVCTAAEKACPTFPEDVKKIHRGFEDPAKFLGSEEDVISFYRDVRDQIKDFSYNLIEDIGDFHLTK